MQGWWQMPKTIRVFPRRTKWTPTDPLAFSGPEGAWPPLDLPPEQPVKISVTFTADILLGERLKQAWKSLYPDVQIGGPAFGDPGGEFIPGLFLKDGVTITSRGCIRNCKFCLVPKREGKIREIAIKDGYIIQDNNLLACSQTHVEAVFDMLRQQPKSAILSGLDARLLTDKHINLLETIRFNQLWFAYDNIKDWANLVNAAYLLSKFPKSKKFCYVLIGFEDDTILQAEKRLIDTWNLGFMPFAMLYKGPNGEGHNNVTWKHLQRTWCRPAAYKTLMKGVVLEKTSQNLEQDRR